MLLYYYYIILRIQSIYINMYTLSHRPITDLKWEQCILLILLLETVYWSITVRTVHCGSDIFNKVIRLPMFINHFFEWVKRWCIDNVCFSLYRIRQSNGLIFYIPVCQHPWCILTISEYKSVHPFIQVTPEFQASRSCII